MDTDRTNDTDGWEGSANLSSELREPVDRFLDAVELAMLAVGSGRSERHATIAELELQILTMIDRRRSEGDTIDVTLVKNIVDGLDPPSAYGARTTDQPQEDSIPVIESQSEERSPRVVFWKSFQRAVQSLAVRIDRATAWLGLGFLLIGLFAFLSNSEGFIGGALLILSTLLGAWTFFRIQRSGGESFEMKIGAISMSVGPLLLFWVILVESGLWAPVAIAALVYVHFVIGQTLWMRFVASVDPREAKSGHPSSWAPFRSSPMTGQMH